MLIMYNKIRWKLLLLLKLSGEIILIIMIGYLMVESPIMREACLTHLLRGLSGLIATLRIKVKRTLKFIDRIPRMGGIARDWHTIHLLAIMTVARIVEPMVEANKCDVDEAPPLR